MFMLQIWCWKRFSYCKHQFSYFSKLLWGSCLGCL